MKKIINIKTNGVIPEMNYRTGPILVPCKVDVEKIRHMLLHGRTIVELNPNNYDEKIQLTLENVYNDNFATEEKKEFENPDITEISKEQVEEPDVKPNAENIQKTPNANEQPVQQNETESNQPKNNQQASKHENKNQSNQKNDNKSSDKKNANKK